MADNLIALDDENQASLRADEATPAVSFSNDGSGPGLRAFGLVSTSGASVADLDVSGSSATRSAGIFTQTVVGNMSIGVVRVVGNSVASGAVLEFSNKGFASITSVILTTVAHTDYAIRVQVGTETRWIPLFQDAAIVGAAAF